MFKSWWMPTNSRNIKAVPWLSPAAVAKLTAIIQPHFRVLEHGCGGSTLWFAERVQYVIATDANSVFRDRINDRLDPQRGRVFAEIADPYARQNIDKFDLLLIDGEPVTDRAAWLIAAPDLVKSGGWVILDNANRPEYTQERAELKKAAESYESINANEGGTLYLITDFYRLK